MKKIVLLLCSFISLYYPSIYSSALDFYVTNDLQGEPKASLRDQFFIAVGTPETPSIEPYLSLGADVNMHADIAQPLHAAAYTGNTTILKELIAHGASVNARDNSNNTPLFFAVKNGSHNKDMAIEKIKLLIASGADVNAKNSSGVSPLQVARDVDIAKILIEAGANVNAKDANGNTPIMSFADLERIKTLIGFGADINARNNEGDTLLHKIAKHEQLNSAQLIRILIEELGADANAQNDQGNTPLNTAYAQLQFLLTYTIRNQAWEQNILQNMVALITSFSQKEIQHVIPAIMALTKKRSNLNKDVGGIIAAQLVPEIVNEKLAVAERYLPQVPRDELTQYLTESINRAITALPRLRGQEFTEPLNSEEALGEWDTE